MQAYLRDHSRYWTTACCNRASSYARCIKLSRIDFPDKATEGVAWDLVGADSDWWDAAGLSEEIDAFATRYNHQWQIGVNGRSGGYMVLYRGYRKSSGYKSRCTNCGQLNYAHVLLLPESPTAEQLLEKYVVEHDHWVPAAYNGQAEVQALGLDPEKVIQLVQAIRLKYSRYDDEGRKKPFNVTFHNICGVCHKPARVNLTEEHTRVGVWPGRGTDESEDFENWSKSALEDRTHLVWDFDKTVNQCIALFIDYCKDHRVVEKTVMVPKTVRVAVGADEEDEDA